MLLCIGFWTPIGRERLGGTAYQRFDNLLVRFMDVAPSTTAVAGLWSSSGPFAAAAMGAGSAAAPSRGRWQGGAKPKRGKQALNPRPSAPEPTVAVSSAPSPIEGIPEPAAYCPASQVPLESYSADLIREAFAAEPSKLLLDAKTTGDKIVLRLEGICRWQGLYIARVAVSNQTGADFFIKELSAYAGPSIITVKSYFRLFVEPGRTRDGHVVFDPAAGAKVKIKLKEDRERGRVIEVPVPYPF